METIECTGTLQIRTINAGSKSEGRYAILLMDEGREYTLYRAGFLPMDDPYFDPYDGAKVTLTGEEESNHYFRVMSEPVINQM